MENFGIQDGPQITQSETQPTPGKSFKADKRKSGGGGTQGIDLSQLDEKSIKILAKLMLALMELNVTINEFFEGAIFEQLVKSKQQSSNSQGKANGARKVEIINAKDFFDYLQARGVRKSAKPHLELSKLLQLDPNYPDFILVKRLSKAIDEIAKNEELMEGIMAAAGADENNIENDEEEQEDDRLVTIGEEDDKNLGTHATQKVLPKGEDDFEEEEQVEEEEEYA